MDKRGAKERYKALYQGLNSIILKWDPFGLSNDSEIVDEFSHEVATLLAALTHVKFEADAIDAVQRIFAEAFSQDSFPRPKCERVGREVFEWWESQQ